MFILVLIKIKKTVLDDLTLRTCTSSTVVKKYVRVQHKKY